MSYGVKYIFNYISEAYSHACEIRILERDYAGEAAQKSMGASPVLRRDSADNGIAGTSLELTIQADADGELMELYTVDNKRYMVELVWDGNIIWRGYILPEQYSEPYVSAPYDVAVTASDGLGILKGVSFALTGRVTLLEIVKYCCDLTGLSLGFTVWSTLAEVHQGGGCAWEKTTLDAGVFAENSCYEVLEKVMTTLDSVITQGGGRWIIEGAVDRNSPAWAYSNALVLQYQPQPVPWVVGSADDDFFPVGSLECDILPAKKNAVFTYDYNLRSSFIPMLNPYKYDPEWSYVNATEYVGKDKYYYIVLKAHGSAVGTVNVNAGDHPFRFVFKFVICTNKDYSGGNLSGDVLAFSVMLTNGVSTYYINEKDGWSENKYVFKRRGPTKVSSFYSGFSESDFTEFSVVADAMPISGVLSVIFENVWTTVTAEYADPLVGGVVVTEDVSPGVDITAELVSQASEEGDDVELSFGDAPAHNNATLLYANYLANGAGLTSSWSIAGGASDSFAYTMLKSVCSRLVVPRRQLSGVIQGRRLAGDVLLQDKYSGYLLVLTEYQWRLYDDEMTVTMEQFAPYTEISGSLTESERVTGGGGSEYRSSGENETRVYQMGSGVPMRIVDLPEVTMEDDSVIEVDHTGADRSGKVTIGEVMRLFRERYMEPYFDLSVVGAVGVKGDLFAYGGVTAGGPGSGGGSGTSYNRLDDWASYNAANGDVLSALLGYDLKTRIDNIDNTLANGVLSSFTVKVGSNAYSSVNGVVSLPAYPTIPTSLKNPNALSWSGYSNGSYDGSAAKSIVIPTTLPASDVYAWAKASSKPSYTFDEIGSKPTTLAGYGITDGLTASAAASNYVPLDGDCTISGVKKLGGSNVSDFGYIKNGRYIVEVSRRGHWDTGIVSLAHVYNGSNSSAYLGAFGSEEGLSYMYFAIDSQTYSNAVLKIYPTTLHVNNYEVVTTGNYSEWLYGKDVVNNLIATCQPLSTAINTSNIASQSVAYAINAGTLDGVSLRNIKEGYYYIQRRSITTTGEGWYRVASAPISSEYYIRNDATFTITTEGGNNEPSQVQVTIGRGWRNVYYAYNTCELRGASSVIDGAKIVVDGDTYYIEIHAKKAFSAYLFVHYPSASNGVDNIDWSWSPSGALVAGSATGTVITSVDNHNSGITVGGKMTANKGFVGDLAGNASTATKLQVARTIWGQSFDGTGNVDGNMTVNGNIVAYGGISAGTASDYRLKENIRPLDGALGLINRINVKSFAYNSIARRYDKHLPETDTGYIAQEFETLLPQYVMKMYESDYLGIRYEKMIPYLTAGIQEVDKKTERIKQVTRSILVILERHGASEEEKNEIRNNINLLNN